jgi:hypothetical protein
MTQPPPGSRVCSVRSCHTVLPTMEQYRFKTCSSCLNGARMRRRVRMLRTLVATHGDTVMDGSCKSEEGVDVPRTTRPLRTPQSNPNLCPQYQHFDALLSDFKARLTSFLHSQMHYLQFKLQSLPNPNAIGPMNFNFDGEYSTVADPTRGRKRVLERLATVKKDICAAIGLNFRSASQHVCRRVG